jgi:DNA-binding transcriptional ArsR family regulator
MPLRTRRVTDAAALKALAHPARLALLGVLVTEGPKTASQAAALVGESASNCSWHLRKLAEHGFVREVAGVSGRQRPWQAVSEGLTWGDDADGEDDPGTRAAADSLTDVFLDRELQRLRAARAGQAQEPAVWREATTLTQSQLWLTAEEAKDLCAQLNELLLTHADRLREPAQRPEGARLMSLVGWVVPSKAYDASPAQHDEQVTGDAK